MIVFSILFYFFNSKSAEVRNEAALNHLCDRIPYHRLFIKRWINALITFTCRLLNIEPHLIKTTSSLALEQSFRYNGQIKTRDKYLHDKMDEIKKLSPATTRSA